MPPHLHDLSLFSHESPTPMPKKSDRSRHGSAMSQLLPDVSLEEEDPDDSTDSENDARRDEGPAGPSPGAGDAPATGGENRTEARTTEEQFSSSTEVQNKASKEDEIYSSTDLPSEGREGEDPSPVETETGSPGGDSAGTETRLSVVPDHRPELSQKLGPYVSTDVDDALETVYLILRRRFGARASKSLVVEAALRYVLSDCLDREEGSELMRWFETVTEE